MSVKHTVAEVKRLLSPGRVTARKGWFGSKARNHVAFTIHGGEAKASKS